MNTITMSDLGTSLSKVSVKDTWDVKADEDAETSTHVNAEFVFDGLTVGDVLTYAVKNLRITRQNRERKMTVVPANITINVPKPGTRATREIDVDALSADQARTLEIKLQARLRLLQSQKS